MVVEERILIFTKEYKYNGFLIFNPRIRDNCEYTSLTVYTQQFLIRGLERYLENVRDFSGKKGLSKYKEFRNRKGFRKYKEFIGI